MPYHSARMQKRYQTGEAIGRAAFDGIVSRAKETSDRRQDLATRAEAALISGGCGGRYTLDCAVL